MWYRAAVVLVDKVGRGLGGYRKGAKMLLDIRRKLPGDCRGSVVCPGSTLSKRLGVFCYWHILIDSTSS